MKFASLRARLTVVGVLVALLAVVVTAFAVQQVTERGIRSDIERDIDNEIAIRDAIAFLGIDNGGWDSIGPVVGDLASVTGERIAVATLDGEILADSEELLFGRSAPLPSQPLIVDPASTLVDFGFEFPDIGDFVIENQAVADCYGSIGVPFEFDGADETGFEFVVPLRTLTTSEDEQFENCLFETDAFSEGFDEASIQNLSEVDPVQLFIGYGDGRDDAVLSTLRSGSFWLAVLAVVAVTASLAVWFAARMGRPIALLTTAANRMSAGDLDTRVEVDSVDELGALSRAFNNMAASLQAEDQARQTLTTDVAHELRSPLANLRGYLEGIQDGVVQADDATIALLHDETRSMQALVGDLQQLSLAEAGRLNLNLVEADLGDLIERAVEAHRSTAAADGVVLSSITTEGVMFAVDSDRFRQILGNLISNAIRHTRSGGTVAVELVRGPPIAISVRDTGEGIAPHHLPHLFDRFYRADESRTRATGGTGLGLAITRQLVQAHRGTIEVTSELGRGTVFTMSFDVTAD